MLHIVHCERNLKVIGHEKKNNNDLSQPTSPYKMEPDRLHFCAEERVIVGQLITQSQALFSQINGKAKRSGC